MTQIKLETCRQARQCAHCSFDILEGSQHARNEHGTPVHVSCLNREAAELAFQKLEHDAIARLGKLESEPTVARAAPNSARTAHNEAFGSRVADALERIMGKPSSTQAEGDTSDTRKAPVAPSSTTRPSKAQPSRADDGNAVADALDKLMGKAQNPRATLISTRTE